MSTNTELITVICILVIGTILSLLLFCCSLCLCRLMIRKSKIKRRQHQQFQYNINYYHHTTDVNLSPIPTPPTPQTPSPSLLSNIPMPQASPTHPMEMPTHHQPYHTQNLLHSRIHHMLHYVSTSTLNLPGSTLNKTESSKSLPVLISNKNNNHNSPPSSPRSPIQQHDQMSRSISQP